jgi:hypothetical protein
MKVYLIIQAGNTQFPNFKVDAYGKPLAFETIEEAQQNLENEEQIIEINRIINL